MIEYSEDNFLFQHVVVVIDFDLLLGVKFCLAGFSYLMILVKNKYFNLSNTNNHC